MSIETIKSLLKDFGITETESKIYLFLSQYGSLKGTDLAKQIKKDKAQVYHILRSLQAKGLVESSLEAPARFSPVTFEKVVELTIKAKRDEAARIDSIKKQLLDYWKNMSKTEVEAPSQKVVTIEGRTKIYNKISEIIIRTKTELSIVNTVAGLTRVNQFGLSDITHKHPLRSKVQLRFLTDISQENLAAVKAMLKKMQGGNLSLRGVNPHLPQFPRMVIRDKEEALFFITPQAALSTENYDELCLWTNCNDLVQAFNSIFEGLWQNSVESKKGKSELEVSTLTQRPL